MGGTWYLQNQGSDVIGPVTTELVVDGILKERVPITASVCRVGASAWGRLVDQPEFAEAVRRVAPPPPPAPAPGYYASSPYGQGSAARNHRRLAVLILAGSSVLAVVLVGILIATLGGSSAKPAAASVARPVVPVVSSAPPRQDGPTVLASGQTNPTDLAVDAQYVYWTTADNTVMKTLKSGVGTPSIVASAQAGALAGIAVDAQNVYWTVNSIDGFGTVMKSSLNGGGRPTVLTKYCDGPGGIATDGQSVYWTNNGLLSGQGGGVVSADAAGLPSVIAALGNRQMAIDIAVDDRDIFWATLAGSVMSAKKRCSPCSNRGDHLLSLATAQTLAQVRGPLRIAVNSQSVFVTALDPDGDDQDPHAFAVVRLPKSGGTPVTILSGQKVMDVAADEQSVFGCRDDGAVVQVPKMGGSATLVAPAQPGVGTPNACGIAVDAQGVYWTTGFGGRVMKAAKR